MNSGQANAAAIEEAPIPGGKTVLVAFEDGIAWVTLNRPEKRNCINPTIAAEMLQVINALEADKRCQVLVLTGAGDSFCAGMDLKEFFRDNDNLAPNERAHIYRTNAAWQWRQFQFYPKPTIAMVNGWCFGGLPRSSPATSRSPPRKRPSASPRSTGASSRRASSPRRCRR